MGRTKQQNIFSTRKGFNIFHVALNHSEECDTELKRNTIQKAGFLHFWSSILSQIFWHGYVRVYNKF